MPTPEMTCLRAELMRFLVPDLSPEELLKAVRESEAVLESPDPKAEDLARKLPEIPREFFEGWVQRFMDEVVGSMLPERLALMCTGSRNGRRMTLLEYEAFEALHAAELNRELKAVTGFSEHDIAELRTVLEAAAAYQEKLEEEGKRNGSGAA